MNFLIITVPFQSLMRKCYCHFNNYIIGIYEFSHNYCAISVIDEKMLLSF